METKIVVSTSQTSDLANPRITSHFVHDVPDSVEIAIERFGEQAVYDLFKGAYTVAMQAPARRELLAQWEGITEDERNELINQPPEAGGTATAELPTTLQPALQARMGEWKLGEKAQRVVRVRATVDPVAAFFDLVHTLDDVRREEIKSKVAELFGVSVDEATVSKRRRA